MKENAAKHPFAGSLAAGSKAPAFIGTDERAQKISSRDLYSSGPLVIYFYPHDDTPTCTLQACNLRDNFDALTKAGLRVIGISTDAAKKHEKFISKYSLPFTLIADEDQSIADKFGVWGEKKFMGRTFDGIHRTTFLIGKNGIIVHVFDKPVSKNHSDEILLAWALHTKA